MLRIQLKAPIFFSGVAEAATLSVARRRDLVWLGACGGVSGTVPSFKYSDALKNAHITWNSESLDKWLTDTDLVIKDNDMTFRVPNANERRDIIPYLKQISGK